jgi:hypothetical protein
MVVCGVNTVNVFDGDTPAECISANLFGDDFATCMDKGFVELDSEFKPYLDLTVNQEARSGSYLESNEISRP